MKFVLCLKSSCFIAIHFLTIFFLLLSISGCSGGLEEIDGLVLDAEKAAEEAIKEYDSNNDSSLSPEEVKKCPSLRIAFKNIDENSDNLISKEELLLRFTGWIESPKKVASVPMEFSLNGQSLAGAEITLTPETFLGDSIPTAKGITSDSGQVVVGIPTEDLPSDLKNYKGMRQGLYRIKITHPRIKIPAKYNTKTTLGIEIGTASFSGIQYFKL